MLFKIKYITNMHIKTNDKPWILWGENVKQIWNLGLLMLAASLFLVGWLFHKILEM